MKNIKQIHFESVVQRVELIIMLSSYLSLITRISYLFQKDLLFIINRICCRITSLIQFQALLRNWREKKHSYANYQHPFSPI